MAAKRVLNFLWLNLDLPAPPDPEDGSIRQPLPPKYIENVRKAARSHPTTEVVLWVDSQRLTERQFDFLKAAVEDKRSNVQLKDLRSIPAYDQEPVYNEAETNPKWRYGQSSVIWRQVDAAKVLISLQGDYDQTFFADLDHFHLGVTSPPVQGMLKKHGLMIGSYSNDANVSIENQLWGFQRSRRPFFETYYEASLKDARNGRNAWSSLVDKVNEELVSGESIPLKEICLPIGNDGTSAEQPGHECRDGYSRTSAVSLIPKGELSRAFNKRSKPARKAAPAVKATAPEAGPSLPPSTPVAANSNAGCGMQ